VIDLKEKEERRAAIERQREAADPERKRYVAMQQLERENKRLERQHILQEIENDKLERRKAQGRPRTQEKRASVSEGVHEGMTRVSVRQPDSTVLKCDFESSKTLDDLRRWIADHRTDGSSSPYVFQTTFPSRTFEPEREQTETLGNIFGRGGQCHMKVISPSRPRF